MRAKSWDRPEGVAEPTSERLSLVLRALRTLEARGVHTVSSFQLAERFGLNPAQIRKDLAQFGEFGVRGRRLPRRGSQDETQAAHGPRDDARRRDRGRR